MLSIDNLWANQYGRALAAVIPVQGSHPVSHFPLGHRLADLDHPSAGLVSGGDGKLEPRKAATAIDEIAVAHSACLHMHTHLVFAKCVGRKFLEMQRSIKTGDCEPCSGGHEISVERVWSGPPMWVHSGPSPG